jgi:hypothetical protein
MQIDILKSAHVSVSVAHSDCTDTLKLTHECVTLLI